MKTTFFYAQKFLLLVGCAITLCCTNFLTAQITLNQSPQVTDYVQRICGPGIAFSNVQLTGSANAIANFNNGIASGLGANMNSGVVMSTGLLNQPNIMAGPVATQASTNLGTPGIPALTALGGNGTFDGIILQFDFIPLTTQINVNYQFGSEEYNNFVNGGFNDVFAFYISGPGIVGAPNIALVPNTALPVSVNTINAGPAAGCGQGCTNCNFYIDNCNGTNNTVMDGFTTMLVASQAVVPCSTYQIQLMLADGGDGILDSWILIQENGLFSVGSPAVNVTATNGLGGSIFPEGCSNSEFLFSIETPQQQPTVINVAWSGTAQSGVDYQPLPTQFTIPAGQTTISVPIAVYVDGITEGTETIIGTFQQTVCETGTIELSITDADLPTLSFGNVDPICVGEQATIVATAVGGSGTFNYSWQHSAETTSQIMVSPTETTTYTITATDQCNTSTTSSFTVNVTSIDQITAIPGNCNASGNTFNVSGEIHFTAPPSSGNLVVTHSSGLTQTFQAPFVSPIAYTFNDIPANGATNSITVTFDQLCEESTTYVAHTLPIVVAGNDTELCLGQQVQISATGAATYNWDNGLGLGEWHNVTPTTTTTYTVTGFSEQGCTGTDTQTVTVNQLPTATINQDSEVCLNGTEPLVTFQGNGVGTDYTFTYTLDGGAPQTINSDAQAMAVITHPTQTAGTSTYTLTQVVANQTGCLQLTNSQVEIVVNPLPTATIQGPAVVCLNSTGNEVTVQGNGLSTDSYDFTVNTPSGSSTVSSANGIATIAIIADQLGMLNYDLITVSDNITGCSTNLQANVAVEVLDNPTATISEAVEACLDSPDNPTITITPSNGISPFTIAYSIGGGPQLTQVINSPSQTFTIPTNPVGTVQFVIHQITESGNGCTSNLNLLTSITIHPLPTINAGLDTAVCVGNQVTLTASGGTQYVWSDGVINGTPFIPTADGFYTVVGTDENGCSSSDTVNVQLLIGPEITLIGTNLSGCDSIQPTLTSTSNLALSNCNWSFSNGLEVTGCGTITPQFNQAGLYSLIITSTTINGCIVTDTFLNYLEVFESPVAAFNLNPDKLTTDAPIVQTENLSTNATTFSWNFGDNSATSTLFAPSHQYPDDVEGNYLIELIAISDKGCIDTTSKTIKLTEELIIYVPNSFTPDGDSYNTVFLPVLEVGYDPQDYTLLIFDRWGEIIFESHDVSVGWNGSYGIGGASVLTGTYLYKIIVGTKSGVKKTFVGHVNLIK